MVCNYACPFAPNRGSLATVTFPERVLSKLRDLPDKPGCYMMRDQQGKIIYVGKAVSLRKRVQSYFRDSTLRSATPKVRGLVRSVHDIDIIVVRNEAEALLTEGRLIKEYRPRYNVSFKDDKRFLLLAVDLEEPFPRFRLGRLQKQDGRRYFGPYANASATRATLDFVEKRFGLRKCRPRLPDEETYKHCLNDIVRFCAAPCVGRVSPETYRERVDEACAFLRGDRPEILSEVRARMTEASEGLDFERAAVWRDTLLMLQSIVKQRARMAPTPQMRKEQAIEGLEVLQRELKLPALPRRIEAFDISNISGTYAVASMVCATDGMPDRSRYRRFRIRTVEGSDDPAMMAEAVRRRYRRLLDEEAELPGLLLVDGGITQLSAARAVLDELGIADMPVAGLAKRYEEVYHGEGPPLLLPRDSQALKVLQRLRDEAHRFALTYHRTLRRRRIRESILDEVPGIGVRKKEMLLKHFGSVTRMLKASVAELAEAPGIGPELARHVADVLDAYRA